MNVDPTPGLRERNGQATWAEGAAREAGQGEACGALPHLPSGLLQRREGALRAEPVQAGREALGLRPGKPERPPTRPGARPGA